MKQIRGRYGHYKLLQTEEQLCMHLTETHVFSRATFFTSLKNKNTIFIRPLLGPQEVQIIVKQKAFEVIVNNVIKQFTSEEDIFLYLTEEVLTTKYYVIQVLPSISSQHSRSLYTIHRKSPSANWKVVNKTVKHMTPFQRRNDFYLLWKLNQFLVVTATKLGAAFQDCHTIVMDVVQTNNDFLLVDSTLHARNSKWSQYNSFMRKRSVRSYIPSSDICTEISLWNFIHQFRQIILKPCVGQQGKGIVKISIVGYRQGFEIHERNNKFVIENFKELSLYIQSNYLSLKDYIVQHYISLASVDDCPYDIRVITQIDSQDWIITGMMAKIAAEDYFITNRAQKLLTLENALLNSNKDLSRKTRQRTIEKLCRKCSGILVENEKDLSIIGFDVGIDKYGGIWMIEANYTPSLSMFYGFNNNEIHERINHYLRINKKEDES